MATLRAVRIAVDGCGHGKLDAIYASVQKSCESKGWDGVDLLIICGDFQAVRTRQDLNVTAMPAKYRKMGDFHHYYYGTKTAPFLTVFIGGNHEASNYLWELYYGGWVAPNIYYLGTANVLRFGSIKIAALSGIWKGRDYRRPHFERLPYDEGTMRSIYHQRELDVRKLLSYRNQVDMGLSHDWPHEIWKHGDYEYLFSIKPFFLQSAQQGGLGSKAATEVLSRLRPPYWFSAHLHCKYVAFQNHEAPPQEIQQKSRRASFGPTSERFQSVQAPKHEDGVLKGQTLYANGEGGEAAATQASNASAISASSNFSNIVEIEDKLGHEQELAASQEERAQNGRQKTTSHDFEEAYRPAHIKETEQALSRYSQFAQNIAPRTPHYDRTCFSKSNCRRKSTPSGGVQQHEKLEQVVDSAPGKPVELVDHISEELRTEAGGISQLFAPGKKFGKSPDLPLPQTITNKVTQFLALSKPENGFDDEFLQLLEVEPINIEDKSIPLQKPFKLQYDPEWLAILRTFASETRVGGSPSGKIPSHRGDTHYRDRIIEEEKWVQENIVKKGLLDVPENFEITVNTNEQEDGDTKNDDEMPQEQTNPQTVKFCNLIGIENKFDFSEEDRNARMASGVSARKQR